MTGIIDILSSLAQLQRELGDELFAVLISSNNITKVREFAKGLVVKSDLPTEMIVGGRTYDILSFLQEEDSITEDVAISRAKEMNAHQDRKERRHFLKHQNQIPAILRDQVVFVFTDDLHVSGRTVRRIACVYWSVAKSRWVNYWGRLTNGLVVNYKVLRRK